MTRDCQQTKVLNTAEWQAVHKPHGEPEKCLADNQPPRSTYQIFILTCPCGARHVITDGSMSKQPESAAARAAHQIYECGYLDEDWLREQHILAGGADDGSFIESAKAQIVAIVEAEYAAEQLVSQEQRDKEARLRIGLTPAMRQEQRCPECGRMRGAVDTPLERCAANPAAYCVFPAPVPEEK